MPWTTARERRSDARDVDPFGSRPASDPWDPTDERNTCTRGAVVTR
ncbi:hypothetical protein ARTHRO9V_510003 [Arthrobacter sp. 9V]|nr:hypothetical protein ARTHRO9V_510003 [Arthrobacter sp. 9V]